MRRLEQQRNGAGRARRLGRTAVAIALATLSGGVGAAATPGDVEAAPVPARPAPTPTRADGSSRPLSVAQAGAQAAEPLSKDELFGVTRGGKDKGAGAEPLSKDELFGTADGGKDKAAGVRLSGFLDGTAAYTYAQPRHWSQAVGRLQVAAQGDLAENVKWKVAGRVDADLVYFTSDFYLDPVKKNQRFSAFWGENYLDFSAGSWDFRLGAQQIVWGEVVGLFVADVVSARDTREFLLPSFDIIRIPQWAARAEYFAGDTHLELVWIPVQAFDRIGKPGADFYPAPLPSPTSPQVAALFQDPDTPSSSLRNSSGGVRANTLVSGWDVAGFYYRSYSTAPTFYRVATGTSDQPFVYQPRYDRIWQGGATATKDFGEVVFRGEAVYTHGLGYSVTSLATPDGVVQRPTLDYILSVEFAPADDWRVNIQGFQRVFYGGDTGDFVVKSDGIGASVFVSTKIGGKLEPQLLWLQNFKDGGGLIRPRLNWYPATNTTVGAGVDIFTGQSDGFFGRYGNRDRAYADVRYNF
jgi:hypothetical protein